MNMFKHYDIIYKDMTEVEDMTELREGLAYFYEEARRLRANRDHLRRAVQRLQREKKEAQRV